jgi:toxin-antitoxin system PIN domain toxin
VLLLDVNVVLAAHRDDHPHHRQVRPWLDALLGSGDDFGVPTAVWASFLRLATNRRIFVEPTPLEAAFGFVEAMVAQPGHLAIEPGVRHLALVRRLCDEGEAVGDLLPDAVLGAIALEHGATVATLDRDFARFPSVAVRRPGLER